MERKKEDEFDPEAHYNSKIMKGTLWDQGQVLELTKDSRTGTEMDKSDQSVLKGKRRVVGGDDYSYDKLLKIHEEHNNYLGEIIGKLHPSIAMATIYKADLTGAKIKIAGSEGVVAEERKNSLIVVFPGNFIRCFPKRTHTFSLSFKGTEYLFLSHSLKKNRFLKR